MVQYIHKTLEVLFIMNKNDLVRAIANKARITIKDAGVALDAVLGAITDGLNAGEKVQISGFGTLNLNQKMLGKASTQKQAKRLALQHLKFPHSSLVKHIKILSTKIKLNADAPIRVRFCFKFFCKE